MPLSLGHHVPSVLLVAPVVSPGVEAPLYRASTHLDVVGSRDSAIEPEFPRRRVPASKDSPALVRPKLLRRSRGEVILVPVRAHGDEPRVKHGAYPRGAAALGEPFDHRVEQPLRLGEVEPGADVPAKRRDAVLGVDPVVGHAHVVLVPHRHLPQPHETQLGLPRAFAVPSRRVLRRPVVEKLAESAVPRPRDPRALRRPVLVRANRAGYPSLRTRRVPPLAHGASRERPGFRADERVDRVLTSRRAAIFCVEPPGSEGESGGKRGGFAGDGRGRLRQRRGDAFLGGRHRITRLLRVPRAFLLEVAAGGRDSNFVSFAHRLQFLVDRGALRRERGLRVDPRGFRERPGELRLFPPGLRGRHSLRADGFSLGGDLAGLSRSSPVRFGFLRERREFPLDVFAIGARVLLCGVQLCLQHHARGLSLGFERLSLLCPRGSLLLEPSSRVFLESR